MTLLVPLEDALVHLRYSSGEADDDLAADAEDKLEAAQEIVLAYLKAADDKWTAETAPKRVKSAIKLVLGNLWAFRGMGEDAPSPITVQVEDALIGLRDPTLA